jgi:hypothetical protein
MGEREATTQFRNLNFTAEWETCCFLTLRGQAAFQVQGMDCVGLVF